MANRLSMAKVNAILSLHQSGHSNRRIAELLNVDRETVGKYVSQAVGNPPNAPTGSSEERAGSIQAATGPPSACDQHREVIRAKLEQRLSAKRIHQDLVTEHGFTGHYWSVRRYVARLRQKLELPFRRLETVPGEEAQVDFGSGAPILQANGSSRRPWIFRIVLSHSRKAYSEAVWRQTTDTFMQCLENAFHYFGGVPKRLVIDNLKAAVPQADWYAQRYILGCNRSRPTMEQRSCRPGPTRRGTRGRSKAA